MNRDSEERRLCTLNYLSFCQELMISSVLPRPWASSQSCLVQHYLFVIFVHVANTNFCCVWYAHLSWQWALMCRKLTLKILWFFLWTLLQHVIAGKPIPQLKLHHKILQVIFYSHEGNCLSFCIQFWATNFTFQESVVQRINEDAHAGWKASMNPRLANYTVSFSVEALDEEFGYSNLFYFQQIDPFTV